MEHKPNFLAMSKQERKEHIEHVLITYPVWESVTKEISDRHERGKYSCEPQCIAIVGPTGAGKTTLINHYIKKYPAIQTPNTFIRKATLATFFQPPTEKNVAQAFLEGYEDPRSTEGSIGNMTKRIKGFNTDCQTEIHFIDELQEVYNRDKQKIMQNVTNWLKFIIKDLKGTFVLCGLEGQVEQIININPQLARLFGPPIILSPFAWDKKDLTTKATFIKFLNLVENQLPFPKKSDLTSEGMAWRLFASSRGRVGFLMSIIRESTHLSIEKNQDCLSLDYLAKGFEKRNIGRILGIDNPFIGDGPPPVLPPIKTDDEVRSNQNPKVSK